MDEVEPDELALIILKSSFSSFVFAWLNEFEAELESENAEQFDSFMFGVGLFRFRKYSIKLRIEVSLDASLSVLYGIRMLPKYKALNVLALS